MKSNMLPLILGCASVDKELWREPVSTTHHFKLEDDQVVEVAAPHA